jgi:lysophospholipase L1-like esterase
LYYDSFVDGTHPNDYGMVHYAAAYERKLRDILNEPMGGISTEIPVTQNRDANTYNWNNRHEELLKMNREDPPEVCFFGNSITHFWGGKPAAEKVNGPKSWKKYFGKMNIRNFGFGWDRVENVLWRVYHDELDGFNAKQILLMIGTNNISINATDDEITEGIRFLINAMKTRQPEAKITLIGIYPRKNYEDRITMLNLKLAQMAELEQINYTDPGKTLLNEDGKIDESLFLDGIHPNEKGYKKLGAEIIKQLK